MLRRTTGESTADVQTSSASRSTPTGRGPTRLLRRAHGRARRRARRRQRPGRERVDHDNRVVIGPRRQDRIGLVSPGRTIERILLARDHRDVVLPDRADFLARAFQNAHAGTGGEKQRGRHCDQQRQRESPAGHHTHGSATTLTQDGGTSLHDMPRAREKDGPGRFRSRLKRRQLEAAPPNIRPIVASSTGGETGSSSGCAATWTASEARDEEAQRPPRSPRRGPARSAPIHPHA